MRIIKTIENVDFFVLDDSDDWDVTDENINIKLEPKHGIVIYIAGMIDGDEDSLMCLGAEDGSNEFRIAFYEPFKAFSTMWDELMKL